MNKIPIIAIIIAIVIVGIIAVGGIGSDDSVTNVPDTPSSDVVVETDESGVKHFSASISDKVGVTDVRP